MKLVVDASVAAKWFVREALHEEALALLLSGEELEAPDLIVPEVVNVAWKKAIRREVTEVQAHAIAGAVGHYFSVLHPSGDLAERALELALQLQHPVYDCLYLALAEALSVPLVTADDRFQRRLARTEFALLLRHLGSA